MKGGAILAVAIALLSSIGGCTTASRGAPMTLAQCAAAPHCRISGVLSAREIDHVIMGQLDVEGSCIAISLPARQLRELQRSGPARTTVEGRVFPSFDDPDLVYVAVNGRRVGRSHCGDFYIFVAD